LPSGVNNVDIDTEMAKLAEAQIQYNFSIKFGQGVFKKMNAAIKGQSLPIQ
jgi:flagellar basal-body rod protein FlgB